MRKYGYKIVIGAVLCALVASGSFATGATQKRKPVSQALVAKRLAIRVMAAHTKAARYKALLAVMRALHVGVYSGRGKAVLRGSERGKKDFYLYDFEVKAIAAALGKNETSDLAGVAGHLNVFATRVKSLGMSVGRESFTVEIVRQTLVSATQSSLQTPTSPRSLVPLLVRELGLRQSSPYDLAANVAVDRIKLDALQQSLLAFDLTEALISQAPAKARSVGHARRATQGVYGGPCDFEGVKAVGKWGKWILSLIPGIKYTTPEGPKVLKIGDWIKLINILVELGHGTTLGIAVDFQATSSGQANVTHYGPPGEHSPIAARELVFQVGIQMLVNIPESIIKCGKLAGLEFPHKGPMQGVPIHWNVALSDYDKLKKHGTVVREDKETNGNGVAVLVFRPKDERMPGFGERHLAKGNLEPRADVLSKFGNVTGTTWELISSINPRRVFLPWAVEFHKPRGFRFSGVKFAFEVWGQYGVHPDCRPCRVDYTIEARICGDDPYAGTWDVHTEVVANFPFGSNVFDVPRELDFHWENQSGSESMEWIPPTRPGDPPQIRYTLTISSPWVAQGPTTVTVPVVDASGYCPDNSNA